VHITPDGKPAGPRLLIGKTGGIIKPRTLKMFCCATRKNHPSMVIRKLSPNQARCVSLTKKQKSLLGNQLSQ
jgi:hypothetical protein